MGSQSRVKQPHCPRFHAPIIQATIGSMSELNTSCFVVGREKKQRAGKQLGTASQDRIKEIMLPEE